MCGVVVSQFLEVTVEGNGPGSFWDPFDERDVCAKGLLESLMEAVRASFDSLGPGEQIRTMNSWVGTFE